MITPRTETTYVLDLMGPGDGTLDAIATWLYCKPCVGQQAGDMLANDSHRILRMDEDAVAQYRADNTAPSRLLGVERLPGGDVKSNIHHGHNWFQYWLSLGVDPEAPTAAASSFADNYGTSFRYDFQVYRQAPTVDMVLADLIHRRALPYGTYRIDVAW